MIFRSIFKRRLRRAVLVCVSCLALFAGVGFAHVHVLANAWWLLAVMPIAAFGVRRHGVLACCLLAALFFGMGWWRGSLVMSRLIPFNTLVGRQVTIIGRAANDGAYGTRYQTTFGLQDVQVISPKTLHVPGSLSVAGFGASIVFRGDSVQVSGKLRAGYGGTQGGLSFAKLQVLQSKPSAIDSLRLRFAAGLQSALPEPLASFGLGLLIGQRNTLPADVSHTLLAVGLTHIIAVSGYNLTIIVDVVRRLCGKRSKYQTAAACAFLILIFLAITGNSPSIVRAAIISMLSIVAWYFGRVIKPLALLLTAGAITVVANPLYLWGNSSWYLSFLAFFGVVVVAPLITKRVFGDKQPKLPIAIIIESLCAEAMTLPYVLHVFGQMSFVGLLANLFVAAFVPLAMLLCLVAGLAGMFAPAVAGWFAWPAKMLLTYMLDAAHLLSCIPHSFVEHIGFSLPMMLAAYAIVGVCTILLNGKMGKKYAIITDRNK